MESCGGRGFDVVARRSINVCSLTIAGELVTTVSFLRSLVVNKTKTKIVFKPQASYRRGKRRQV